MLVRHIWDAIEEKRTQEKTVFASDKTESISLASGIVKPGKSSQMGLHIDEEEIYVILKGRALLTVGNELQEVRVGDAAYIPRNTRHQLACISDENLEYITFINCPK